MNLSIGNTNETYIHILDRAILTLVGSIIGILSEIYSTQKYIYQEL